MYAITPKEELVIYLSNFSWNYMTTNLRDFSEKQIEDFCIHLIEEWRKRRNDLVKAIDKWNSMLDDMTVCDHNWDCSDTCESIILNAIQEEMTRITL